MKKYIKLIAIAVAFSTIGCQSNDSTNSTNDDTVKNKSTYEYLEHPVIIQTVEKSGMKYMIASGKKREAGVDICNITLDSLMVEYYKRELKKLNYDDRNRN